MKSRVSNEESLICKRMNGLEKMMALLYDRVDAAMSDVNKKTTQSLAEFVGDRILLILFQIASVEYILTPENRVALILKAVEKAIEDFPKDTGHEDCGEMVRMQKYFESVFKATVPPMVDSIEPPPQPEVSREVPPSGDRLDELLKKVAYYDTSRKRAKSHKKNPRKRR
jgi:hypothetical protein